MSTLASVSGRTHLALIAGQRPIDLDAERRRRAQHVREARLVRRPGPRAAPSGAPVSEGVRHPASGRDGPDAA